MDAGTKTTLSYAGALKSAGSFAAMIFCCLPFAAGIFGAGVVAFGARFAPLQPYLIGLKFARASRFAGRAPRRPERHTYFRTCP